MATLEDAAQDLADKLDEVSGDLGSAQEAIAHHLEDLHHLDENVAADWNALTEAVTSFLGKVEELEKQLAQDGTEASNELGGLRGEIEGAHQEAEGEIHGSRDDIHGLADHLRALQPALDSLVATGVEAAFAALKQQIDTSRDQLEGAITEAVDFLHQVASDVTDVGQEIEERCQALHDHMNDTCTAQLQDGLDSWQTNVDELEQLVRGKLDELPANARDVVEYAMTECTTGHEEEFDRVLNLIPEIEQAIEELRGTVEETSTDIGEEAFSAIGDRLGTVSQSIQRTGDALDAVKQVLASYTFVSM